MDDGTVLSPDCTACPENCPALAARTGPHGCPVSQGEPEEHVHEAPPGEPVEPAFRAAVNRVYVTWSTFHFSSSFPSASSRHLRGLPCVPHARSFSYADACELPR